MLDVLHFDQNPILYIKYIYYVLPSTFTLPYLFKVFFVFCNVNKKKESAKIDLVSGFLNCRLQPPGKSKVKIKVRGFFVRVIAKDGY